MATIYKRGRYWWISYTVGGRRVSKSLKVEKESDAAIAKKRVEVQLHENPESLINKNSLVDVFWDGYLRWAKEHKREATIEVESITWRQLTEFCKPKRLGDVTAHSIERFKSELLRRGLQKRSVNNKVGDIQAIYNHAGKLGFFNGMNPCANTQRYKLSKNPPKFLTHEQLDRLLSLAEERSPNLHMFVAMGALGGFRKKEISFARWDWFDFDHDSVTLKSHAEFELKDSETRTLPLFGKWEKVMSRYRVVSYSDYCLKAERRSEGKNRYRVDLKKSYAALCKDAELAWCTPHILRHTFGSLLAQSNVSLYKIANWMGHSKPSTTQIYAHLVPMKSDLGVFD